MPQGRRGGLTGRRETGPTLRYRRLSGSPRRGSRAGAARPRRGRARGWSARASPRPCAPFECVGPCGSRPRGWPHRGGIAVGRGLTARGCVKRSAKPVRPSTSTSRLVILIRGTRPWGREDGRAWASVRSRRLGERVRPPPSIVASIVASGGRLAAAAAAAVARAVGLASSVAARPSRQTSESGVPARTRSRRRGLSQRHLGKTTGTSAGSARRSPAWSGRRMSTAAGIGSPVSSERSTKASNGTREARRGPTRRAIGSSRSRRPLGPSARARAPAPARGAPPSSRRCPQWR